MKSAVGIRVALVVISLAISAPAILEAQERKVPPLPKPTLPCGGPLAVILLKVVDGKGAPVPDAIVEVHRERDGKQLPGSLADFSPDGEYVLADDMALPLVPASGARRSVPAAG